MLSRSERIHTSREFSRIVKTGRRKASGAIVAHWLIDEADPTRFGFVVSKAVGNSVVRHRVTRRLRHVVSERVAELPTGTQMVLRALPRASDSEFADLQRAFDRLVRMAGGEQREV